MLERVAETISRYSMFPLGARVGVGLSGGPDSTALLRALIALAPRWNLHLTVLHINHGLRGAESDADEQFVRATAAEFGLPCVATRGEPPSSNIEEHARHARYAFFAKAAREHALDRVATGHTLDDQAETVLFRLLRGAGATGLSGIHPLTAEGVARPLIDVRRAEVLAWLREIGQPWREDSSNTDRAFRRNRIRLDLLPALRSWNPRIDEALAHSATLAAEDDAHLAALAVEAFGQISSPWRGGVVLNTAAVQAQPGAIAGRVLRLAIAAVRGDLRRIEWKHLRRLEEMLAGQGRQSAALPGLRAVHSLGRLLLIRPAGLHFEYRYEGPEAAGWHELPGRRLHVGNRADTRLESGYNKGGARTDRVRVYGAWELRNWRPGDRYQPAGSTEPVKLRDLFQLARIPSWERPSWPIISDEGTVVWAGRFGPAADASPSRNGNGWLEVTEVFDDTQVFDEKFAVSEPGAGVGASI
ncbi:MAG: tRNA lysidine(34) synthetase TilS [Bryobacteraceae bacterium]